MAIGENVRRAKEYAFPNPSSSTSMVASEDEVFVGHGVMFTNDRHPRATTDTGELQRRADWLLEPTRVYRRASIGSHATILCGLTIGEGATIESGAVVTRDVPPYAVVVGVPARAMNSRS
jgi:UDP-2-acetamido-3-amino-2,3-dideoxy-glucuronate N-acetyltransferase